MEITKLYQDSGGLLEGHFLLRSGLHSSQFLQSCSVMQHPLYAEALGELLAEQFEDVDVDFVIGPAIGGITLAFAVAKALGVRALFAEKNEQGGMFIRPGLTLRPGEHFLAVEDVVTSGRSVKRAIQTAEELGGVCVGIGAIIDRSGGQAHFGLPFKALLSLDIPAYAPASCPLCQAGIPLEQV